MEIQERSGEEVDTISEDNEKCYLLHLGLWWTSESLLCYSSNRGEINQIRVRIEDWRKGFAILSYSGMQFLSTKLLRRLFYLIVWF